MAVFFRVGLFQDLIIPSVTSLKRRMRNRNDRCATFPCFGKDHDMAIPRFLEFFRKWNDRRDIVPWFTNSGWLIGFALPKFKCRQTDPVGITECSQGVANLLSPSENRLETPGMIETVPSPRSLWPKYELESLRKATPAVTAASLNFTFKMWMITNLYRNSTNGSSP